ncbi:MULTISPECIES: helix-turn-helix transcriptional regulator [unclassified Cupriavidus]|uniref:ArsR/SmtB family transcription factor n=1 Tax=unclassified Cupriavidus TaxID=2640874 RepID=UPI001C000081|nr:MULTISPECIES: helix-turn-helix transcriptional regulator [unclassified Cupriavidus]MCA3182094.1 helix-turn-helix transcriptional regulator [Cupriavidus sp.]MCA3193303.1 helix-turn-helix transcriptional regulator [Cupriavidus sp.]MCA3200379.1 helix-turn-helix transcriptional regulator [Cupriavidus sp.]MCA3204415.1 helix-turn-helix transcriptional regulator [Cupriavidus sp.]QWE97594.1 ArsR family transcriptional regulator [Cupriavidus sp. EM10]
MEYAPGISQLAGLLADPGRAAMLWALMDGSARPAGELALIAGLSASSTSGHLARLSEGGLLAVESRGRNRYYRLAAPEIGVAIEALATASLVSQPPRVRAVPVSRGTPPALRQARTCYDHLAGELAVGLFERMSRAGWLTVDGTRIDLTGDGSQAIAQLGIDLDATRRKRRQFACTCPDWSERKPHLGGALGAAMLETMLEKGWIEPTHASRALRVTPRGHREIGKVAA